MEDTFSRIILPILFGLFTGLFANYMVDSAVNIPRSWSPQCVNCGKPMTLKQFVLGSNCSQEGCRTRRRPRFISLILLSIFFSTIAWQTIDLNHLTKIHFILLANYLLVVLLIDMLYKRVPTWVSVMGIPLSLFTGLTYELTVGEIMLGGATGMLFMWIWHALLTGRYKIQLRKGLKVSKPPLEVVTLAAVIGMMVGFPKILFTFLLFFYIAGILGIIILILNLIKNALKNEKLPPSGVVLILGAALTMLIIK